MFVLSAFAKRQIYCVIQISGDILKFNTSQTNEDRKEERCRFQHLKASIWYAANFFMSVTCEQEQLQS